MIDNVQGVDVLVCLTGVWLVDLHQLTSGVMSQLTN